MSNVHAIPADYEDEHGRDVEATTAAAREAGLVESNVTASRRVESATAPRHGIETAALNTEPE